MATPRKFDPAPLVAAGGGELRALARRLGVDPAILCRPLSVNQADKYAIAIGVHPTEVWGPDFWSDD
jgi:lambda repressor-like predicted transcriptional regulator